MNTRHILMRAAEGQEPFQIDAGMLNDELTAAFGAPSATTWSAFHNAREAIVDLYDDEIDEQAVRDVIIAHVNRTALQRTDAIKNFTAKMRVDGMDLLQNKVLFDHENRIRALEGAAPVTVAQFRTALINRMKALL